MVKQEIAEFSKKLNIEALYEYALSVKASTDEWLKSIHYEDIYDYVKEKGGPYFEMLTAEIESKTKH